MCALLLTAQLLVTLYSESVVPGHWTKSKQNLELAAILREIRLEFKFHVSVTEPEIRDGVAVSPPCVAGLASVGHVRVNGSALLVPTSFDRQQEGGLSAGE